MTVKEAALRVSPWVPKPIGRIPYRVAMGALRARLSLLARESRPEVWPRNSYVLGTLKPLVSDLDFTLWLEREPSPEKMGEIARALRQFARLVPFLGEANTYVSPEARSLVEFANYFEVSRDPRLQALLGIHAEAQPREMEAAVFLLRMMDSDVFNLHQHPAERLNKWREHLRSVAQATGRSFEIAGADRLLQQLKEAALDLLGLEPGSERDEARTALSTYLEHAVRNTRVNDLPMLPWGFVLYPHRFIYNQSLVPKLQGMALQVFLGQLSWEIWGLQGQYRLGLTLDRRGLPYHLTVLEKAIHAAVGDETQRSRASRLGNSFARLRASVERLNTSVVP
jgi:hypothetical protein